MPFQLYENCPGCNRQFTTHSSQVYIHDRWDPADNWHPITCGDERCCEAVRNSKYYRDQPFDRPLPARELERRRHLFKAYLPLRGRFRRMADAEHDLLRTLAQPTWAEQKRRKERDREEERERDEAAHKAAKYWEPGR